jgi:hypothetical protein
MGHDSHGVVRIRQYGIQVEDSILAEMQTMALQLGMAGLE